MPHGHGAAKKIVIDEARELADKLQNGGGADLHLQGKAIGLLVRMISPMFEADLVTVQECSDMRKACSENFNTVISNNTKSEKKKPLSNENMKIKIGPFEISGSSNPILALAIKAMALIPFCVLFYMMGRLLSWW